MSLSLDSLYDFDAFNFDEHDEETLALSDFELNTLFTSLSKTQQLVTQKQPTKPTLSLVVNNTSVVRQDASSALLKKAA